MAIMNAKPEGLKKVYALPYWDEVEEEKEDYDFILEGSVLLANTHSFVQGLVEMARPQNAIIVRLREITLELIDEMYEVKDFTFYII